MIDVLGSLLLLAILSPVFFMIAAAIKLTSRGPILFQQKRIGEHGTPFTFLKFRSMYMNNDSSEHKEYVRQLIAGQAEKKSANGNGTGVFKLTNDPRITPVGRMLRRSSLDELPQLINVLRGEMSLVRPCRMKWKPTPPGIAAVCSKRSRESPDSGRCMAAAAWSLTTWSGWICAMPAIVLPCSI